MPLVLVKREVHSDDEDPDNPLWSDIVIEKTEPLSDAEVKKDQDLHSLALSLKKNKKPSGSAKGKWKTPTASQITASSSLSVLKSLKNSVENNVDCESSSSDEEQVIKKRKKKSLVSNAPALKSSKKTSTQSADQNASSSYSDWEPSNDLEEKVKQLKHEVKELKAELHFYRSMKHLVDEFPAILEKLKKLTKQCEGHDESTKDSHQTIPAVHDQQQMVDTDQKKVDQYFCTKCALVDVPKADLHTVELDGMRPNSPSPCDDESAPKPFAAEKTSTRVSLKKINNIPSVAGPFSGQVDPTTSSGKPSGDSSMRKQSTAVTLPSGNASSVQSPASTGERGNEVIMFGTKSFPLRLIKKARHLKPTILASELTSIVFTSEEKALCTLKGRSNNKHLLGFSKTILDEDRVKGIINYVAAHFGKNPNDMEEEIRKSIAYKLNNFTKSKEGKRILRDKVISTRELPATATGQEEENPTPPGENNAN